MVIDPRLDGTMAPKTDALTRQLQDRYDAACARLSEDHGNLPGRDVAQNFSDAFDAMLAEHAGAVALHEPSFEAVEQRLAIVAVGGYGRAEMNLHSDLDLAFVFDGDPTPEDNAFIKAFLYPLWNLKVEVGYSLKSVRECLEALEGDIETATALLQARLVWGRGRTFQVLRDGVRRAVHVREASAMLRTLFDGARARRARFSDTVLLLEPNIKESPGALRDIHTAIWAAYVRTGRAAIGTLQTLGVISAREERSLRRSLSFLLELRNALHLLEGRKTDVLNVERQIRVAESLGFKAESHLLPEEQLMRAYYEHAGAADRVLQRVLRVLDPGTGARRSAGSNLRRRRFEGEFWRRDNTVFVDPKDAATVTRDPGWMMRLFHAAALHGVEPDEATLNLVEAHLGDIDDAYRSDPVNRDRFLAIVANRLNAGRTLRMMHYCRFLESLIPEFALVRNLPRIDFYHQFTVDEHLLRSAGWVAGLLGDDPPASAVHVAGVAREVLRTDLLVFALLMHDVGKGEGRGHVIRGARMIQRVGERMGLGMKERQVLHQLVVNHQKISYLALKRDTEDPRVAEGLARDLGSRELLRMLYVLTCCDIMGVSNESWNDWRATLLASLYEKTMAVLRGRGYLLRKPPPPKRELAERVRKELDEQAAGWDSGIELAPGEMPTVAEIESFVSQMPERYVTATPPLLVGLHTILKGRLSDEERIAWELETPDGHNYAILHSVAWDTPGLFANHAGALASRGYNILSAQLYTSSAGLCVDAFQLQRQDRQPSRDAGVLERTRVRLNQVLRGQRDAAWLDQMPQKTPTVSAARLDQRPPSVVIHEEEDRQTVVEVRAPDRPALLHEIASCFDRNQIDVHIALASTESYQVVDVFYVTDWENNRLEPGPKTEKLRKELLEVVSPGKALAD